MSDEIACKRHPCAPHGFDRNGSHSADRYVCEGWQPDQSCAADKLRATIEDMKARMMRLDARVMEGEREANELGAALAERDARIAGLASAIGTVLADPGCGICEQCIETLDRALAAAAGR